MHRVTGQHESPRENPKGGDTSAYRVGRLRPPGRACSYARSMRAYALWLWIDSKFSTSTA